MHHDVGPGGRVGADIGQQVVEHLAQARAITQHLDRRARLEPDRPLGADRQRGGNRLGRQRHEFHGVPAQRAAFVELRQQQEVGDQLAPKS